MTKLTPSEAGELLHEASRYLDVAEHAIRELPPTPGRSEAEQPQPKRVPVCKVCARSLKREAETER